MCRHEIKVCPACKQEFECKAGTIMQCHCSQVILSAEQLVLLERRYNDCVCRDCLERFGAGADEEMQSTGEAAGRVSTFKG